jgi:hypothetical protein
MLEVAARLQITPDKPPSRQLDENADAVKRDVVFIIGFHTLSRP